MTVGDPSSGIPQSGDVLDISVVAPVYRNADTLPELVRRVQDTLRDARLSHEIILVDDASPDRSCKVAQRLAREDPTVGVVALDSNVGQHRAVLAGLRRATGGWVVVLDADLQDPPEAIPRLLDLAGRGYDAVFAGRRGHYQAWHRMLTSRFFKLCQHVVTGVPLDAGMYFAATSALARRLVETQWPATLTVVTMIGLSGARTASLPVSRAVRAAGASAYTSRQRVGIGLAALAAAASWRLRSRRAGGGLRLSSNERARTTGSPPGTR